jgi:hypothetical protein
MGTFTVVFSAYMLRLLDYPPGTAFGMFGGRHRRRLVAYAGCAEHLGRITWPVSPSQFLAATTALQALLSSFFHLLPTFCVFV